MLIAICSKGSGRDSELDDRFGRTPWFVLYDSESEEYRPLENSAAGASGGAGGQAVQLLLDAKVEAVITAELGPKAADAVDAFELTVLHRGSCRNVGEAAAAWKRGDLKGLERPPLRRIGSNR